MDFFLSIRDGEGYSQGVTNPSNDWTVMYQAGNTNMAAWANAANCAIIADAFRIQQNDTLRQYYTDEAIKAFRYASRQPLEEQMLDELQDVGSMSMRGRDFKQMAAAFLYNLTGDTEWERIFAEESMVKDSNSLIIRLGRRGATAAETPYHQLWASAAYLITQQPRHYDELYQNIKASIRAQTMSENVNHMTERPSRRTANDARHRASENLQLVMLNHYLADAVQKKMMERAMYMETSWGLGRNPGNIVEMTGLGERHLTDVYSTGRNDGDPGTHPGQTPFNGTETWSPNNGGDARMILKYCYPNWDEGGWPQQESYFNQRYFWVNAEFTPRETMRGKMALLAYLYGIR